MSQASDAARARTREPADMPPLAITLPGLTNRPAYAISQLATQALSPRYPLLETEPAPSGTQ